MIVMRSGLLITIAVSLVLIAYRGCVAGTGPWTAGTAEV